MISLNKAILRLIQLSALALVTLDFIGVANVNVWVSLAAGTVAAVTGLWLRIGRSVAKREAAAGRPTSTEPDSLARNDIPFRPSEAPIVTTPTVDKVERQPRRRRDNTPTTFGRRARPTS